MRIYIAHPITKGDQFLNVAKAIAAAERCLKRGHQPFVPGLTFPWHMQCPDNSYERWMDYAFAWLDVCEVLVRVEGESDGADREVARAVLRGIPVFFGIDSFMASEWWTK